MTLPRLLVIAGATATGKTGLAIRVAEALRTDGDPAEVISADSRQVYRGLDIGTAKATAAERITVPHHGLDLADPDRIITLADYAAHVRDTLAGIGGRGGTAILVGGTGLYLRAIARGIDTDALPSDAALRTQLEEELASDGLDALAARLRDVAPSRAARTDLRNPRRVTRALEIAALRGDADPPALTGYAGPVLWLGLRLDDAAHREWIAARARAQFDAGLIEEARGLRERFDPSLPAFSAIGYREAWSVIDGAATREEAIAADAARNVAFAKRQRTWFKAEPDIEWLDAATDVTNAAVERARALTPRAGRGRI